MDEIISNWVPGEIEILNSPIVIKNWFVSIKYSLKNDRKGQTILCMISYTLLVTGQFQISKLYDCFRESKKKKLPSEQSVIP